MGIRTMANYDSDDLNILDLDRLLAEDDTAKPGKGTSASSPDGQQNRSGKDAAASRGARPGKTDKRAGSDAPSRSGQPRNEKDTSGRKANRQKGKRHLFSISLILLIAIAAVVLIAFTRLLIWNQGIDIRSLGINPADNANRYNVEVNDSMVYLTDSQLQGHEDDGITTILCLGDEPFSLDETASGLAGQIAALGGDTVSVINAAFPSSQVTCENAAYQTDSLDDMDDIFNLFYVSYAISIDDFSSLETVASLHTDEPAYANAVQALKDTDFSKVDMMAIMYDASDYINGASMQNPDNPDDLTTYVSSLSNSFRLIQEQYPWIRIVFLSPYYAEYEGMSGRTNDRGNGTITNYFQWAYDTCGDRGVSFLDNYYGSVNENNYREYTSDGVHLNSAGCTKIADHFVWKVLQDNYDEYNVEEMAVAE